MESHELRLWEIIERIGKGYDVSEDDLPFAETCLDAPEPQAQANACEILFRCSTSESVRCHALDRVEQLCANAAEEDYVVTLLIVMLYPPLSAFSNRTALKDFTVKCARSSRWQIRTNAVSVLQRLARTGDQDAIRLTTSLANDTNSYVRENAQNALQSLGEQA